MAIEVGTVCMKIAGREAGKYCVVLKKVNESFVLVTGPKLLTGVKRRKANINHLEPLPYNLGELKENASDEEVISAFEKTHLASKLGLKFPSAADMKSEKAKEVEKESKKKEEAKPKEKKEKKEKEKSKKEKKK